METLELLLGRPHETQAPEPMAEATSGRKPFEEPKCSGVEAIGARPRFCRTLSVTLQGRLWLQAAACAV